MAKIKAIAGAIMILVFCLMFVAMPAFATEQNHECQGGHNCNEGGSGEQTQVQGQQQGQEQTAEASVEIDGIVGQGGGGGVGTGGDSRNEIKVEGDRVENNSSNIVLVPNNNTENCLRVIGLAFGKNGESAAFGWPYRSKKCDFEGAADDAFAAGERELGWFWKCENPNLYKSFKDKGESKEAAKQDCLDQMVGGVTAVKTITTLTEQLEFSEEERRIARKKHTESVERLSQACEESKDRILTACVNK